MNKFPRYVYPFIYSTPLHLRSTRSKTNEALRRELSIAEEKMRKLEAENK